MNSPAAPRVLAGFFASAGLAAIVTVSAGGCNAIIGLEGPLLADGSPEGDTGHRGDSMCPADAGSKPEGDAGPRSCERGSGGMTDCRSSDGGESCCTSLDVKGGSYDRTYTNTGDGGTATADLATVSAFRLDKYEVTVGRFAAFVTAWNQGCGWKPAAGSGKHTHLHGGRGLQNGSGAGSYEPGWLASDDARVDPTSGHLNCNTNYATSPTQGITLPINCVSWWEAYAFCIWDGGFLPSEAEWEYAAAGGSQLLEYPWGNTPPGTSNLYAIYGCDYPMAGNNCTGTAFIAPVGTAEAGAGAFGQVDLMGSVAEWTLDTYARYVVPCDDCAHLEPASSRVVRGGSFESPLSMLSPTDRDLELPAKRRFAIGFRCARAP